MPSKAEGADDNPDDDRGRKVLPHSDRRHEHNDQSVQPIDPQDELQGAPGECVQCDEHDEADKGRDGDVRHDWRQDDDTEAKDKAHDYARDTTVAAAADIEERLRDERATALGAEEGGDDVANTLAKALAPSGARRRSDLVNERLRHEALQDANDGKADSCGDDLAPHGTIVPIDAIRWEIPSGPGLQPACEGRVSSDLLQRTRVDLVLEDNAEDHCEDEGGQGRREGLADVGDPSPCHRSKNRKNRRDRHSHRHMTLHPRAIAVVVILPHLGSNHDDGQAIHKAQHHGVRHQHDESGELQRTSYELQDADDEDT
mmetsp:Transcript_24816/g.52600  ORF Transcript_24816/g.52600 Transcript_24816/m.52600 type:complete len:315 (+) Transcript_24816:387-1331(+)